MLASIAGALNKHSVALAQIATLQLMFPDPPFVSNARPSRDIIVKFIRALNSSGLIKEGWDAGLHPRWPTGAPDGQGGRFAPKNELVGQDGFAEDTPRTKPAGMPEGLVQVAARGNEACATALVGAVGMCAATAGATVACPETGVSCAVVPEAGQGCVAGTALAMGICRASSDETPEEREEREKRCEANLERDLATCKALGSRYGKARYRVCEQQAMTRYGNCLAGRDGDDGINAPLPPWGR